MINYFILAFLMLCSLNSKNVNAQYVGHFSLRDQIKHDTLVDKATSLKYIIDKKRIRISAVDKVGKVLWITDPAVDNKLEEYRVKRPTIVYFNFGGDRTKANREVIWITYINTQFGYLDKKTGKFTWLGQD
ncbi:hypothetical protein [uncultured Hymenobacter sp.]|uniref:hypothetical protein n=1 Tax=uncultured Hymenobacter sp. TaxID=170016 RepID=UPI0035CBD19B